MQMTRWAFVIRDTIELNWACGIKEDLFVRCFIRFRYYIVSSGVLYCIRPLAEAFFEWIVWFSFRFQK